MPSLFENISFEDFYKLYPRKVGKADAAKAWAKVSAVDKPVLMSRLPGWLASFGSDLKYLPYPATWLRARRWEDDQGQNVPQLSNGRSVATVDGQLGVHPVQPYLSGVRDYPAPTEEERLEGIKILRQCVEKLTANDLRLRLKAMAIRRKR